MFELLEKIKSARERKQLTQTQVAEKIGIGLRQYQNIEAGHFPKYKTKQIRELEKILEIGIYNEIYKESIVNEPSAEYKVTGSLADELEKLALLNEKGRLTDEEFRLAKEKILK
ncbi:MAG: hypothetical protein JWQ40_2491 [Segetibacter sp.]|nr:hypothetical protein [Segetibacter sp.]